MATPAAGPMEAPVVERPETPCAPRVYDRSSLDGDYMVMIAGQTPEDWENYAPESRICEYIDGIVYMPSPATDNHQDFVGFLFDLLNGYRFEQGCGIVRTGPGVLRLEVVRKFEPDIFVLPDAALARAGERAALVIEVLSKSTRSHDLDLKRPIYLDSGVSEAWFLDERDRALIVERRTGGGVGREVWTEGVLRSTGVPGFWIDVSWLWPDPLPNPRRCLEAILAGPPA